MANPYIASNIVGADSPTIGADKTTYSGKWDTALQKIDEHDHTTNKGLQIPTAGVADSAITTAKIADTNVTTAKIAASAVTTAKIASGNVTTDLIADINVTAGKLATDSVTTGKIADLNVTTAKINDLAVTTGKIADLGVTTGKIAAQAVTQAKKAPVGEILSGGSGSFSTSSATIVDVTSVACNITTTGRPVRICVIGDGTTAAAYIYNTGGAMTVSIDRDGTVIYNYTSQVSGAASLPPSAFLHEETPSAAAHTYKLRVACSGGNTINVVHCALLVYEI